MNECMTSIGLQKQDDYLTVGATEVEVTSQYLGVNSLRVLNAKNREARLLSIFQV